MHAYIQFLANDTHAYLYVRTPMHLEDGSRVNLIQVKILKGFCMRVYMRCEYFLPIRNYIDSFMIGVLPKWVNQLHAFEIYKCCVYV